MSAHQVRQQNRQVTDAMPDVLDAIREDLEYWELHQLDGDPESVWWRQVHARIDGLRHRENRILSSRLSISVTNNAIGSNSRINQNSVDQSANQVSEAIRGMDWERLAEQLQAACRFLRADSQWTSTAKAEVWRIAGGDNGIGKALLQKAGAMLLKSPQVRAQLSEEVARETDNMSRWLLYLKQKGCHEVRYFAYEDVPDGTKITHLMGGIRDLAVDSARCCIECAVYEI